MAPIRVHCTPAVQKAARKSRHRVDEACAAVCLVLAINPAFGVVVKGHATLRKMRVAAPGLTTGKSGGYRLIYSAARVDESWYCALLALYFKGDREDLEASDYVALRADATRILGNVIAYDWTDHRGGGRTTSR